jgi:hypothetical protein
MRLGTSEDRAGNRDRASLAFERGLQLNGGARSEDAVLLGASTSAFPERRMLVSFVADCLPDLRSAVDRRNGAAIDTPPRVYIQWAQGMSAAPPVVQLCQRQLRRLHAEEELVCLSNANVGDYVQLPPWLAERQLRASHISDILRLELLWRYGGVWMDATCLPQRRVFDQPWVASALSGAFFAFEYRPLRLSSWFIASPPGNRLVGMLLEAQYAYWRRHQRAIDYFLIHDLFEALVILDDDCRRIWERSPRPSADAPHALQHCLSELFDADRYRALLDDCFVHKLTHRLDPRLLGRPTMAAHLLADSFDDA